MKKIFTTYLFLALSNLFINAQNFSLVEHYSILDGLSQNSITTIYQSKDGILWFGTQDGVNFFDGYEFKIIKQKINNPNSLTNNHINDITEDYNGNIIFATENGITVWNRLKNKYIQLFNKNIQDTAFSSNILKMLYLDSNIWAITANSLLKIDKDFKLTSFPIEIALNAYLYSYSTLDIKADDNKNIWIASKNGIILFNTKTKTFYRILGNIENLSNKSVKCLIFDRNKRLWAGTSVGLNYFLPANKFQHFYFNNENLGIKENYITTLLIDSKNQFWVGTQAGLKIFDGTQIKNIPDADIQINSQISNIFQDNSNNLWIGTVGDGLYKLPLQKRKFEAFKNFPAFISHIIFSICIENNKIWLGSNIITVLDKNTKKIIKTITINDDSSNENIILNLKLIDGKIWAASNKFVYIIDTSNYKSVSLFDYFKIPENPIIAKSRTYNIIKDSNNYWFATFNGLIKLENNKNFKIYKTTSDTINSISSADVINLLNDGDSIWVCTNYGLNLYNKKTEKFTHWNSKNGLPNDYISSVYKTDKNTIWISTISGFSKFDLINKTFENFSTSNYNFQNDFFYCILSDKNKNLWLTSNNGVLLFNPKNNSFKSFSVKDGLPSLEFNTNAYLIYKDTIYFGTTNGLTWTSINEVFSQKIPQKTIITNILVTDNNHKTNSFVFIDTNITYKFAYKSFIKIYFTIPDFHYPKFNKFKYKIIGYNQNWSEEQTDNFINIIGLSPGKYKLYIIGANSDGVWNVNPTLFSFEIVPPFSKSIFAKILIYFALIVGIILLFLFFYLNIRKENRILTDKNLAFKEIEKQKILLEEQAKNIVDSLNYAQRIIKALIPPIEQIINIVPESFVYLNPKEIVSGDFYWFTEKNSRIYIAAVDCTGHGIPGAFMSIIGMNMLNRLVNEGHTDPGVILNLMNRELIETFKKKIDESHIKDGMDLSLCIIDLANKNLLFAGAYNPAYIIRNDNIIQLRGDRKSIGTDFEQDSFTTISFKLFNDDIVYVFSDGFTDQFGGQELKKFKFSRFRFLLLSIYKLPFEQQKQILHQTFLEWKNNYEQVDDILIIGFKPLSRIFKENY